MRHLIAIVLLAETAKKAWGWLYRLGGVAFIFLGLADNSVIPLPGSMDALLIVLSAHQREWWWYYALWATAGSMLGGYLTYRLASKGGKEALEKKVGAKRSEKAYKVFDRWGFGSIFVGAIAPPPTPIVPFLMTAGVMQYPRHKFLVALGTGRALRFALIGWVAHRYGQHIFRFLSRYYKPALWTLVTLAVVGGIVGIVYYLRWRKQKRERDLRPGPQPARAA